jgi:CBS domain-containing protein
MNLRRMPLVLALVVVIALASLAWLMPLSGNSQAAPAPSSDAVFKGKVLLVSTTNMMTGAFLVEKAQVQKIGDHSFLVGKGAADARIGGWYKDRTIRLQMEHVVSITEFDDLKDAKKAMEEAGRMTAMGAIYEPAAGTIAPGSSIPATPTPPRPSTDRPKER